MHSGERERLTGLELLEVYQRHAVGLLGAVPHVEILLLQRGVQVVFRKLDLRLRLRLTDVLPANA